MHASVIRNIDANFGNRAAQIADWSPQARALKGSGPLLFSPAIAYHFYFKRGREALMSDPIVVLMLIAVLIVWAGGGLGWILPIGFLRKDDDVSRNQRFWGRVIFSSSELLWPPTLSSAQTTALPKRPPHGAL